MIECHWRMCADCANNSRLEWSHYEQKWKLKEQAKMTREEAIKVTESVMKYRDGNWTAKKCIECFEALGLLKFDEPKKEVKHILSVDVDQFKPEMHIGITKLELWPEGLVLWVGGEIRWRSWHEYSDITNPVK